MRLPPALVQRSHKKKKTSRQKLRKNEKWNSLNCFGRARARSRRFFFELALPVARHGERSGAERMPRKILNVKQNFMFWIFHLFRCVTSGTAWCCRLQLPHTHTHENIEISNVSVRLAEDWRIFGSRLCSWMCPRRVYEMRGKENNIRAAKRHYIEKVIFEMHKTAKKNVTHKFSPREDGVAQSGFFASIRRADVANLAQSSMQSICGA